MRGAGFEIAAAAGVGGSAYDVSASVAQARELHSSGVRHVPLDCGAACGEGVANCTVEGAPEVAYEADETPMVSYANAHAVLEARRREAKARGRPGPRGRFRGKLLRVRLPSAV